jgi:DNA-binding XRE family transcriptional regulator
LISFSRAQFLEAVCSCKGCWYMGHRTIPLSAALVGFGDRLKLARLWLRLNQATLARDVGASPQRWNHWEKGRYEPDLAIMVRLKQAHQISLDWIFAEDHRSLPPAFIQFLVSYGAAPDAPEIARRIRDEWGRATGFTPSLVPPDEVAGAIAARHPPRVTATEATPRTLHEDAPKRPY